MKREELLKTAKPILFNTEMVRAILDGRKMVTRRVVKPQPELFYIHSKQADLINPKEIAFKAMVVGGRDYLMLPRYQLNDILYVRETFCEYIADHVFDGVKFAYKANTTPNSEYFRKQLGYKWKPSIHMPKEAARIFLKITDVRVERLQDITTLQALREGFQSAYEFNVLWDKTIKPKDLPQYGWNANPWVWVYEFERIYADD